MEMRTTNRVFEKIAAHCDKKLDYISLTFMLGFFVTVVIDRWRNSFNNMGYIEKYDLTMCYIKKIEEGVPISSKNGSLRLSHCNISDCSPKLD
ncbi:hypothetical protein ANCDUO_01131 [Ancylostoma duodenale]|uniref:Bestrophin homolog n=1 Tax=Ancylostoma duodenale TaxID=51022 RepID=A0A0C2HA54_9BILA|nr:hypothetical protein ANCDUO_01131 [Ancylostoma duodenale]